MPGPWEKYQQPQAADDSSDQSAAPAGPWSKYQAKPAQAKPDPVGAAQAGLEHFGNAASLGYLPQLSGLASQLIPNPTAELDAKLKAQGFNIQQPKTDYIAERDATSRRLDQQAQDHPYASAAGTVGGALTSAIAGSALTPINAATKLGRVAQAAKGGAVLGALSNPGDTEGDINPIQAQDRLKNAAVGAALGSAGQGAVEGLSGVTKAVTSLPQALQSKAQERAFKSAGAMLKDYRQIAGQGRIDELGRFMLDNGLIKPGMTVADIAKVADALKTENGTAIGGILQKLDEMGAVAPSHPELASAVEAQALPLKDLNTAKPTYNTLQGVAEDIRTLGKEPPIGVAKGQVGALTGRGTEYLTDPVTGDVMAQFRNGKMITASGKAPLSAEAASASTVATPGDIADKIPGTFQGTQAIKKFIADQVEASGGWKALDPTEKNKALRQVYSMISDKLEESAGKAAQASGDKDLLKSYLDSKSGYRNAKDISKIAKDQALRQNANRFLSPTDYLSGASGAMMGAASGEGLEGKAKGALMGAGMGLVHKAARTYGTPMVSLGLDKAGAMLARTPLNAAGELIQPILGAAQRGPSVAGAIGYLSQPERAAATGAVRSVAADMPKGEDRWAATGAEKLGLTDDQAAQLSASPQYKRLLIQASDLSPNSPAMKRIKDQIQKGFGK